jgi:hypothetical protein
MSLSLRLVVIGPSLVREGWLVATGHILRLVSPMSVARRMQMCE